MNTIAYRIYDPKEKKFRFSGSTPSMLANFFKQTAVLHTFHKMEYQMFTGLEDKSKNWIYEGDIVKSGSKETAIIEWNHDGFYPCLIHNKKREIIGNIYENIKSIKEADLFEQENLNGYYDEGKNY